MGRGLCTWKAEGGIGEKALKGFRREVAHGDPCERAGGLTAELGEGYVKLVLLWHGGRLFV